MSEDVYPSRHRGRPPPWLLVSDRDGPVGPRVKPRGPGLKSHPSPRRGRCQLVPSGRDGSNWSQAGPVGRPTPSHDPSSQGVKRSPSSRVPGPPRSVPTGPSRPGPAAVLPSKTSWPAPVGANWSRLATAPWAAPVPSPSEGPTTGRKNIQGEALPTVPWRLDISRGCQSLKSLTSAAYTHRIVTTRLLYRLHDRDVQLSRLQRAHSRSC